MSGLPTLSTIRYIVELLGGFGVVWFFSVLLYFWFNGRSRRS